MTPLVPGETCWRVEPADRVAFLVDNEAYFTALYAALQKARRSILILGWGFDPRTRLFPDGHEGPADPDEVGRILQRLALERPDLDIRLLIWKSALPISASQEFFPHKARSWFKDSRVDFRLDDQVPLGACHHQKLVVIDDRLAFVGGGDISVDRWDSPRHLDGDRRRIMPSHLFHAPRHEVTMMVDGAAARALGEHARERWRRGAGEQLDPPEDAGGDPWPDHVPAHLIGGKIGIARTTPAWRDQPAHDEILRLTLASIAGARHTIYLENQYFTSPIVTEALARRLGEPDGPEVVLVTTGHSPSWFDRLTMDNTRGAMVWRLRSADIFGRFRAFQPKTAAGSKIIVHSKTSVFDDALVRVGSANLNNRSFGFDTELELAVACDQDEARRQAAAFLNRVVGHFLAQTGDAVAKARAERGGLIAAIDALNREGRLAPLDPSRRGPLAEFIAAFHVGDPSCPSDAMRLGRRRRRLIAQAHALNDAAGRLTKA
ncbi:MAG: phospholipase [Phenylobacterium sp.]|uniref:phospholipase D-like domain-containing protein n=1 Tax=Phenylobacterium sp. TaxID=1871053 RepID=UPI0025FEA773|nr:phospholipase D-like domain-containing protein [Phenylobacterium sp.]MBI1196937.1 phospholipase [Phenylobacterium sp.]